MQQIHDKKRTSALVSITGKGGDWVLSTSTGIRPGICCQLRPMPSTGTKQTIGIKTEEPVFLLLVGHDITRVKSQHMDVFHISNLADIMVVVHSVP